MNVIVLDVRDLKAAARFIGCASDNIAWSVARYIGDRYTVPVASKCEYPVPVNLPPDDLIALFVDGNIDLLLGHDTDPDSAVYTELCGDYLIIRR